MDTKIDIVDGALLRITGREDAPTIFCLAGFPDHGYLYEPLYSFELAKRYRLVAIDLWGFGVSPKQENINTISDYVTALSKLIVKFCPDQTVGLVGHSIGATIWQEVAKILDDKIAGLFSIEGNLTPDDAFFTGKAADFDDADEFKKSFLEQVWPMGEKSKTLRRYFAGAMVADATAMWNLGRQAKLLSVDGEPGQSYKKLSQPTLY